VPGEPITPLPPAVTKGGTCPFLIHQRRYSAEIQKPKVSAAAFTSTRVRALSDRSPNGKFSSPLDSREAALVCSPKANPAVVSKRVSAASNPILMARLPDQFQKPGMDAYVK